MTKFSGINFNHTNRLHLVLVIRISFDDNFNYPKVYTSSKTPGQLKITPTSTQFTKYVQNQVQLHISNTAGNMQIFVIHFSFYIHNFKLRTKVIID